MSLCPENPIRGSHLTDNFTFDEVNKQVVPKSGTDTKPGALALNLGNNLPADATNATDALTAAGFNAMANAVDGTAPLCGNEIQQAVTVAVAQSIACDAAAQEAIACAIANNPEAVACLKAVLPSGLDETGTVVLDGHDLPSGPNDLYSNFIAAKWENGTTTVLASPGAVGAQGSFRPFLVNNQNPGKFTDLSLELVGGEFLAVPVAFDLATNTYSTGTAINAWAYQRISRVNHSGTRLASSEQYIYVSHDISADGKTLTNRVKINPDESGDTVQYAGQWLGDDLIGTSTNSSNKNFFTKNVVTGATGTGISWNTIPAISVDYSRAADVFFPSPVFGGSGVPVIEIRSLVRTGNNVTTTPIAYFAIPEIDLITYFSPTFTWTPDNSQLIVALTAINGITVNGGTAPRRSYDSVVFTVNVTATSATADLSGIRPWGTMGQLENPRMSADGNFMTMASFDGTAIFKKSGTKWNQIGHVAGVTSATIVGGVAGHVDTRNEY
jgi:hypothetical protein